MQRLEIGLHQPTFPLTPTGRDLADRCDNVIRRPVPHNRSDWLNFVPVVLPDGYREEGETGIYMGAQASRRVTSVIIVSAINTVDTVLALTHVHDTSQLVIADGEYMGQVIAALQKRGITIQPRLPCPIVIFSAKPSLSSYEQLKIGYLPHELMRTVDMIDRSPQELDQIFLAGATSAAKHFSKQLDRSITISDLGFCYATHRPDILGRHDSPMQLYCLGEMCVKQGLMETTSGGNNLPIQVTIDDKLVEQADRVIRERQSEAAINGQIVERLSQPPPEPSIATAN